jgi:hypothetical protein
LQINACFFINIYLLISCNFITFDFSKSTFMKKNLLTLLALSCFCFTLATAQTTVTFQNPSFEGTPGTANAPPPYWNACLPGYTPDTQPGVWNITLPPSQGNSYLGLVHQISGSWQEGVSQMLTTPLTAGTSYAFTIDLATTNSTQGGITPGPIELQVWGSNGGNSGCDLTELLWSSGNISDTTWQTHLVGFTPSASYSSIVLIAHNLGPADDPYICVDNIAGSYSPGVHAWASPTSCYGNCDGMAHSFMVGGTPPFHYLWTPGGDTTAIDSNLCNGVYIVTVIDSNNITYSDTTTITSGVGPSPLSPPEICIVSVDSITGKNLLVWNKPVSTAIDSFLIYRETSIAGYYAQIGARTYSSFSTFMDMTSNPTWQANRYRIAIKDSCGALTNKSPQHKTIHLTISAGMGGAWNLNWDSYEGFYYSTVDLYRGTTPTSMTLLTSLASTLYSYTDVSPPVGTVYYQIKITSPTSCNPSFLATNSFNVTRSNLANSQYAFVSEIQSQEYFIVFPNPVDNGFTIKVKTPLINGYSLQLMNIMGKVVMEENLVNEQAHLVDTKKLSDGVYFLQLKTDKFISLQKIIIQK